MDKRVNQLRRMRQLEQINQIVGERIPSAAMFHQLTDRTAPLDGTSRI